MALTSFLPKPTRLLFWVGSVLVLLLLFILPGSLFDEIEKELGLLGEMFVKFLGLGSRYSLISPTLTTLVVILFVTWPLLFAPSLRVAAFASSLISLVWMGCLKIYRCQPVDIDDLLAVVFLSWIAVLIAYHVRKHLVRETIGAGLLVGLAMTAVYVILMALLIGSYLWGLPIPWWVNLLFVPFWLATPFLWIISFLLLLPIRPLYAYLALPVLAVVTWYLEA